MSFLATISKSMGEAEMELSMSPSSERRHVRGNLQEECEPQTL